MESIPLFGTAATIVTPPSGLLSQGWIPLERVPAEYLNWDFNVMTQMGQELNALIQFAGGVPSGSVLNQVLTAVSGLIHSAFLGNYANRVLVTQPASGQPVLTLNPNSLLSLATGRVLTANKTLTLDGTDGKTLTQKASVTWQGTDGEVIDTDALVRGVVQGLTMAFVSTTSFSVGAGAVGDSTFVSTLLLSSTFTKTTSAWAVGTGNGGLDTGAIAATTWYAVYLIKRPDTQLVDVLYSTNGTTPTLPANYTLYRRIGWILTNGSSQFVSFQQRGRQFLWSVKVAEFTNQAIAATTRQLQTVTCPANSNGMFVWISDTTTNTYFFDAGWTALTDAAAASTNSLGRLISSWSGLMEFDSQVDASRQIYYRVSNATSNNATLLTLGWVDNL